MVTFTVALAPFAEAKRVFFSGSGTIVGAQIDLDGDGPSTGHQTESGTSTFGAYTANGVGEYKPWDGSSFCSPTEIKLFEAAVGAAVTQTGFGDQLYSRTDGDGTVCFDFTNQTFTGQGSQTVTGGTGIFAGATGTLNNKFKGQILLNDASGATALQAFSDVTTGDIQLVGRPGN